MAYHLQGETALLDLGHQLLGIRLGLLHRELGLAPLAIIPAAPEVVGVLELDEVGVKAPLGHVVDHTRGVLNGDAALDAYAAVAVTGALAGIVARKPYCYIGGQNLPVFAHSYPPAA